MATKKQNAERDGAIAELREMLKPGDTVYTKLNHVSKSGMLRYISVFVIRDNQPLWLDYRVRLALQENASTKHDGIRCDGCGMDMGFDLVYNLSYVLWPKGFECIGDRCPSNDHSNGDRDRNPHRHSDGGYALNQRWL